MAVRRILIRQAPAGATEDEAPHGLICDPQSVQPDNGDVLRFTSADDVTDDVVLILKLEEEGTDILDVFTMGDSPASYGVAYFISSDGSVDIKLRGSLGVPAEQARFRFGIAPAAPVLDQWAGGDGQPTGT